MWNYRTRRDRLCGPFGLVVFRNCIMNPWDFPGTLLPVSNRKVLFYSQGFKSSPVLSFDRWEAGALRGGLTKIVGLIVEMQL